MERIANEKNRSTTKLSSFHENRAENLKMNVYVECSRFGYCFAEEKTRDEYGKKKAEHDELRA